MWIFLNNTVTTKRWKKFPAQTLLFIAILLGDVLGFLRKHEMYKRLSCVNCFTMNDAPYVIAMWVFDTATLEKAGDESWE